MAFEQDLKLAVAQTHFEPLRRHLYSVDASIFEILPAAVCLPKTKEELIAAVKVAHAHKVPITPRGAGTGIAGGALGRGLILDTSKHLDKILEVNLEEEWVRVEPGVVQDTLNDHLAPHGYRLGPDTSSGNRATLGGMIANNSAGAHSLRWGATGDALLEVELLLSDGHLTRLSSFDHFENDLLQRELDRIRHQHKKAIQTHMPKITRHSAGYRLDHLLEGRLASFIAGSEGTLGIITEAKLKIVKRPQQTSLSLFYCSDLVAACKKAPSLLKRGPIALEVIDSKTIDLGRLSPMLKGKLDWLRPEVGALLIVEWDGPPKTDGDQTLTDPAQMAGLWQLRKAGLGLLLSRRTHSRAVAFIEDVAVPSDKLAPFLKDLLELLSRHGKEAGIYGHAGLGCLHVRPFVDLRKRVEIDEMVAILKETAALVRRYGGALTGEHGDGHIRSHLAHEMFGPELYDLFGEIKSLFDPSGLMNPGVITGGQLPLDDLRARPFTTDHAIALEADLCNGNGACRKKDGLMCPSFHAHHDEFHTTRARAQALRDIFTGRLPPETWTSPELYELLEYCIECKGCKTQCPSQVDMAKMKSLFLADYHKEHGLPLRDRLFAHLPQLAKWAPYLPKPRFLLDLLGIDTSRPLPPFTRKRFSKTVKQMTGKTPVVLFADTYTEHSFPHIGHAAHQILSTLGYQVIVPPYQCCGRTYISKGLLEKGKAQAECLLATLKPYAERSIPIVGLEPSCLSVLADEYPGVTATSFEEFLLPHLDRLPLKHAPDQLHLHVHCHHKALHGTGAPLELLQQLPGSTAHLLEASCCGMAGSFGYEKEHSAFSLAIGERHLFPQIRTLPPEAKVIASGFSCRSQITHATGHEPLHLTEYLNNRIQ